jgi:tRNA(adenine34) deaminase
MERNPILNQNEQDLAFMGTALLAAKSALQKEEVPIGAVVVYQGEIVGRGYNLRETSNDPTTHAEIIAIREAAAKLDSWRLLDCTLYVTLEPCVMCMGAIILARIPRLVFATRDPKAGAVGSIYNLASDRRFNHKVDVTEGVLAEKCSEMLSGFFKALREKKKADKRTVPENEQEEI